MIIKTENVTKSFGAIRALRGVTLEVSNGEFLVIFGPNGAGKTTLIGIISTLLKPTGGNLYIDKKPVEGRETELRRKIGVISHQTFLYPDLTVHENLVFYARLYGITNIHMRIMEIIERVELRNWCDVRVRNLSRGLQQRTAIARALIHNPMILLLDEPFTGLDPHAIRRFNELLTELFSEGRTIVMTSHNLYIGIEICTRIAIIAGGKVVYDSPKGNISRPEFENIYFECTGEK